MWPGWLRNAARVPWRMRGFRKVHNATEVPPLRSLLYAMFEQLAQCLMIRRMCVTVGGNQLLMSLQRCHLTCMPKLHTCSMGRLACILHIVTPPPAQRSYSSLRRQVTWTTDHFGFL